MRHAVHTIGPVLERPDAATPPSNIAVELTTAQALAPLRERYRHEMQCQIVRDSFVRRGFSHCYGIQADGHLVGYGLVDHRFDPGTVHEFFVAPPYRGWAGSMFRSLLEAGDGRHIRTQTNDPLLLLMFHDCATNITVENVLFGDALTTALACPGGSLQRKTGDEEEWHVVVDGEIAALAGLLFHYNPPFADVYMEVNEPFRRRGYGSYAVQEVKRVAYELGKVPAARCNPDNLASRRTLERAGLLPCGHVLRGDVVR